MYKKRKKIKLIVKALRTGKLLYQAVSESGISRVTFFRWMKESERLTALIERARALCDEKRVSMIEDALFRHANEKGNTIDRIFFLTNKAPDRYKDRRALVNNINAIKINNGKPVDGKFSGDDAVVEESLLEEFRKRAQ